MTHDFFKAKKESQIKAEICYHFIHSAVKLIEIYITNEKGS